MLLSKANKGKTIIIDDFENIATIVGLLPETIKVQGEFECLHR
jgi:hypothetical protein